MFPRWFILTLLLSFPYLLSAQIDRTKFQRMMPEEQFTFVDAYLTKHWWEFYDTFGQPDPKSARLPDYRFMQSVAKDPKTSCLLRLFWCRNQQFADLFYGPDIRATIDTLSSIMAYARQQRLQAEEGICWLIWCKVILDNKGDISMKQRQRLAYEGTMRGIALLEPLPLSVVHQYHGATYDITHSIWWMGKYFFRIEAYELAWRLAALGDKFAHPQLDTKDGHPNGYAFYKWELLNLSAACHLRLGHLKQAQVGYQKAYAFARLQNDQLRQDISYGNIGVVLQQQGNTAAAQPYLKRTMALAQTATYRESNSDQLAGSYFQFLWYSKIKPFDREQFRQLSPDERFATMDDYLTKHWQGFYYYRSTHNGAPPSSLLADYRFMRNVATDPKSTTLLRVFWVRNQHYLSVDGEAGYNAALDSLMAIRAYAHQHNLRAEEGICWLMWCKQILQYPPKMDHRTRQRLIYEGALRGLNLLENVPISVLHHYNGATYDLTRHLWWVSMYFYQIEEFAMLGRAARLGNRCVQPTLNTNEDPLDIKDFHGYVFYKWHFMNDLGSYHLQMGELAQAEQFFRRAFAFARVNKSPVEEEISHGNIGVVLSKQGKLAAAIPYLEQALQVAQQDKNRIAALKAIVPLAQVYLQLKQYDKAFPTLQRAVALYDPVDMLVPELDSLSLIPLLAGLGEVYQHRDDLKQALYYTQLANRLEEKRRQNNEARIFRQKQEKIAAETYRAKLDQIDTDRQWAIWLRNGSIVGLGLVILFSIAYLRSQRKRRQEAEQQLALIAQEARNRAEQITQLQQAQELIEQSTVKPLPNLAELMELAILTEADWQRFRELFDQVHPNYLLRLRQKYPTLSPAETRIICLSRLSLSTKEMAHMLGVSTDTIVKTRYRIRRKANLSEGADVGETFAKI